MCKILQCTGPHVQEYPRAVRGLACSSQFVNICTKWKKRKPTNLFRLSILFSQYRSCDDTLEVWTSVVFINNTACENENVQLCEKHSLSYRHMICIGKTKSTHEKDLSAHSISSKRLTSFVFQVLKIFVTWADLWRDFVSEITISALFSKSNKRRLYYLNINSWWRSLEKMSLYITSESLERQQRKIAPLKQQINFIHEWRGSHGRDNHSTNFNRTYLQ